MNFAVRTSLSVQLIGDYLLFMSEIILLLNIQRKRNRTGISLKTQIILAVAFSIRYMDLAILYLKTCEKHAHPSLTPIVIYNAIKIAQIFVIYWTILIVFLYFNNQDDRKFDTFRIEILVISCVVLTLIINYDFQLTKILRTFSFCLETVATLPQTYLISKARYFDTVLIYYIGFLSLYKTSHIVDWICSLVYTSHPIENIALFSGIVQLIIYVKFFVSHVFWCSFQSSCAKTANQHEDKLFGISLVQSTNRLNRYKLNESNV